MVLKKLAINANDLALINELKVKRILIENINTRNISPYKYIL